MFLLNNNIQSFFGWILHPLSFYDNYKLQENFCQGETPKKRVVRCVEKLPLFLLFLHKSLFNNITHKC